MKTIKELGKEYNLSIRRIGNVCNVFFRVPVYTPIDISEDLIKDFRDYAKSNNCQVIFYNDEKRPVIILR